MPGKLFTDDLAKLFADGGKKHYRPSNGTEGMMFEERWCLQCKKYEDNLGEEACEIIDKTMAYDTDDPHYPPEWTFDQAGQPMCTAWKGETPPDLMVRELPTGF